MHFPAQPHKIICLLCILRENHAANRTRLFQSAGRVDEARAIHLGGLVETNKRKRIIPQLSASSLGATTTSSRCENPRAREHAFSSPWLESRRQALLSCRRDEIRYFVKVISPRKVSFRRVIASAPFPPTAAALHATRAREKKKQEEESKVYADEGTSRRQAG